MSHKLLQRDPVCGLVALTLFILTIPLSNWVIMNVGLVCPPDGPCLIPVWPGLYAPSAVMIAGAALVLRNGVMGVASVRLVDYEKKVGKNTKPTTDT